MLYRWKIFGNKNTWSLQAKQVHEIKVDYVKSRNKIMIDVNK